MKEVNSLKDTVKSLKKDVSILFNKSGSRIPGTCHIHIRVSEPCSEHDLSSLIGCPVINAVQVNAGLSWKVKIHKQCLYDALQSSSDTHSVRIWRNNNPKASPTASSSPPTSVNASSRRGISVISWNCRGYHNSTHYPKELIAGDADIIILQEH